MPVYGQITNTKCAKSYSSKIVQSAEYLSILFFNLWNEIFMQYNNDLL